MMNQIKVIHFLDPENICLDTKINLLSLITKEAMVHFSW